MKAFPNDQIDNDPSQDQCTKQFPLHSSQIFHSSGDTQNTLAVQKKDKKKIASNSHHFKLIIYDGSFIVIITEIITYSQYSSTGDLLLLCLIFSWIAGVVCPSKTGFVTSVVLRC